jgi:hypothetical protein
MRERWEVSVTEIETMPAVLFAEPGARWRSVAYGPLLCLVILIVELTVGRGPVHWFGLGFCAVLLAGFVSLQVVAGKRHVSVELTESALREGTETVPLRDIATVLPESNGGASEDPTWLRKLPPSGPPGAPGSNGGASEDPTWLRKLPPSGPPGAPGSNGGASEDWQSARALGEMHGVPRRRKGIGLKLRDGRLVQAWARDHEDLRAKLTAALDRLPENDHEENPR